MQAVKASARIGNTLANPMLAERHISFDGVQYTKYNILIYNTSDFYGMRQFFVSTEKTFDKLYLIFEQTLLQESKLPR